MKKRFIIAITVVFLIAGCTNAKNKYEEAELTNGTKYACENEKELTVVYFTTGEDVRRARMQFEDAEYNLENVVSASGAKYSDGKHTWWTKGNSGFFEIDGVVKLKNCLSQR